MYTLIQVEVTHGHWCIDLRELVVVTVIRILIEKQDIHVSLKWTSQWWKTKKHRKSRNNRLREKDKKIKIKIFYYVMVLCLFNVYVRNDRHVLGLLSTLHWLVVVLNFFFPHQSVTNTTSRQKYTTKHLTFWSSFLTWNVEMSINYMVDFTLEEKSFDNNKLIWYFWL